MFYKREGKVIAWVQSNTDFLVKPSKEKELASNPKVSFTKKSPSKSCIDWDFGLPMKVTSRI